MSEGGGRGGGAAAPSPLNYFPLVPTAPEFNCLSSG